MRQVEFFFISMFFIWLIATGKFGKIKDVVLA